MLVQVQRTTGSGHEAGVNVDRRRHLPLEEHTFSRKADARLGKDRLGDSLAEETPW